MLHSASCNLADEVLAGEVSALDRLSADARRLSAHAKAMDMDSTYIRPLPSIAKRGQSCRRFVMPKLRQALCLTSRNAACDYFKLLQINSKMGIQMNRNIIAIALASVAVQAQASTFVLDFSGNICGSTGKLACTSNDIIGGNYGDVSGLLDVSYRTTNELGTATYHTNLTYSFDGFPSLRGVASSPDLNGVAEITFTPLSGNSVTLASFTFDGSVYGNRPSKASILDSSTHAVLWSIDPLNPGTTPIIFTPTVSSTSGLVLRWGVDAYRVGIDNINVSVSSVPETSSVVLAFAGLAGIALTLKRRPIAGI
jgi:hypothetical protein